MSKKKDIQQLEAQRERMVMKHNDLKNRVNISQCAGRRVSERKLKQMKRHKLLSKDMIVSIDKRLAELRRPELAYESEPTSGVPVSTVFDNRISA